MTAPNINAPKQVTGRTYAGLLFNGVGTLLENPNDSGQVWRISTVVVQSTDGTHTPVVTLDFIRFATAATSLLYNKNIAPNTTVTAVTRDTAFYLEEGDSLFATVTGTYTCSVYITYEIIGEPTP